MVSDEAARPVAGATVYYVGKDISGTTTTGSDGTADISEVSGPVSLVVQKPGYEMAQVDEYSTNAVIKAVIIKRQAAVGTEEAGPVSGPRKEEAGSE
jgi:hypothetical protein